MGGKCAHCPRPMQPPVVARVHEYHRLSPLASRPRPSHQKPVFLPPRGRITAASRPPLSWDMPKSIMLVISPSRTGILRKRPSDPLSMRPVIIEEDSPAHIITIGVTSLTMFALIVTVGCV